MLRKTGAFSFRMGDASSLLTWLCLLNTIWYNEGIQVIGGRRTVVEGQDMDLPCRLVDTQEDVTQISWQRKTKEIPVNYNFLIISPRDGPIFVNGHDEKEKEEDKKHFLFIGSIADNNGSIQIRSARPIDDGTYTCIFTVFPSGAYRAEIHLTVQVPPIMNVTVDAPAVVGCKEVTMATCVAANAKPAAELRWDTGTFTPPGLRTVTNSTQHENGTTTVVSHLLGEPTRDANQQLVQCVVTQSALPTGRTLPYHLNIGYGPLSVNISSSPQGMFHCIADGNPTPLYTWTRVGQSPAVGHGDTLTLSLTPDLNGLYVCEASNPHGSSTASLYLYASESCFTCWILLVLNNCCCLIATAVVVWYWKKHNTLPCLDMASKDRSARHKSEEMEVETPLKQGPAEED